MMTTSISTFRRAAVAALFAAALAAGTPAPALAQDDPNPGALSFTGGLDVPSIYYFRGIRQERDPALTLWPYGDLGIALFSGDGGLKSVGVNIGVWNSLHTGTSGTGGISEGLHYEEDFYTTLSLGFGGGVTVSTGYMALTSPNNMFTTVKEWQFKVAKAHWLSPYVFLARELGTEPGVGQADAGAEAGSYLELGAAPSWAFAAGKATLGVPVKLGLSLGNYYEGADPHHETPEPEDSAFGFFSVGGLVTVPLTGIPSRFGSWNIHAGADLLTLGHHPELLNVGPDGTTSKSTVVALIGLGVSY